MIVTSNQTSNQPNVNENVPLRQNVSNTNMPLRRSESSKTNTTLTNNISNNNTLSMPNIMATSRQNKTRPNQFQNNVAASAPGTPVSSSNPISTLPTFTANTNTLNLSQGKEVATLCCIHFACCKYFLFLLYLLLLLSLILNIFLHFIIYGSNMSIAALFLDVHHRHELVMGEFTSLDLNKADVPLSRENQPPSRHPSFRHPDYLHCDRNSFLSLLDEFYHQYPKPTVENPSIYNNDLNTNTNDQLYNRYPSSRTNSYPKVLDTFKNYAQPSQNDQDSENSNSIEEDQHFYSSHKIQKSKHDSSKRVVMDNTWNKQYRNEQRLLAIEIAGLVLLFVFIIVQVVGLVSVIKKHLIVLMFVTSIQVFLFSILVFVSNFGILLILFVTIITAFHYMYFLKYGITEATKVQQRFREDITNEIRDIFNQYSRMTPCIHVSMEQYEQMTQQMLHRYSSPIVYCPHYNESLC